MADGCLAAWRHASPFRWQLQRSWEQPYLGLPPDGGKCCVSEEGGSLPISCYQCRILLLVGAVGWLAAAPTQVGSGTPHVPGKYPPLEVELEVNPCHHVRYPDGRGLGNQCSHDVRGTLECGYKADEGTSC